MVFLKFIHFFFIWVYLWFGTTQLLDCNPYTVHVSLAGYYESFHSNSTENFNLSNENEIFNIMFQTNDFCLDMNIIIFNSTNGSFTVIDSPTITNYTFQTSVSTKKTKYIYNYTMKLQSTTIGSYLNYSILQSNNTSTMNNFTVFIPFRDLPNNTTQQKFLFVGMMDNSTKNQSTISRLENYTTNGNNYIDIIIYLGDMAFNLQDDNYTKGDIFLNSIQTFASSIPFMTTPGMRDSDNNFTYYEKMFQMTNNQKNGNFYSFNMGKAHFIQINMALFFITNTRNQTLLTGWLKNDLEIANLRENRLVRPWIFIYGYNSFYCSYDGDDLCSLKEVKESAYIMETLLNRYKVDAFFSSHYPIYQRSKPLYLNKSQPFSSMIDPDPNSFYIFNPEATLYIVEGVGGNEVISIGNDKKSDNFLFNSTEVGYGILTVINNTYLFYEHYDSKSGGVIDSFYLINEKQKWDEPWTAVEEYWFIVSSMTFVFIGILIIGVFQIYVDAVM